MTRHRNKHRLSNNLTSRGDSNKVLLPTHNKAKELKMQIDPNLTAEEVFQREAEARKFLERELSNERNTTSTLRNDAATLQQNVQNWNRGTSNQEQEVENQEPEAAEPMRKRKPRRKRGTTPLEKPIGIGESAAAGDIPPLDFTEQQLETPATDDIVPQHLRKLRDDVARLYAYIGTAMMPFNFGASMVITSTCEQRATEHVMAARHNKAWLKYLKMIATGNDFMNLIAGHLAMMACVMIAVRPGMDWNPGVKMMFPKMAGLPKEVTVYLMQQPMMEQQENAAV